MLTFDAVTHKYKYNGVELLSVTQVLKYAGMYPYLTENKEKMLLGSAVHRACELDDNRNLDYKTVSQRVQPYLLGWQKFRADYPGEIIANELPLYSSKGYAGTVDRVMMRVKRVAVIDIKTGASIPAHRLQLAAYAELWKENKGVGCQLRWAVKLNDDGTYSVTEYENDNSYYDFLACLKVVQFKLKNGIIKIDKGEENGND